MSTFILIHGGWHGGWAWQKVVPLLEQAGHKVIAPDLPGHGDDRTPLEEITLPRYVEAVLEVMDAQSEPVILVGHSSGGIVITQAAEYRPDKVKTLVYLATPLPRNGESLLEVVQRDPDPANNILRYLEFDQAQTYALIKPEGIRDSLYHDCSDEDAARAQARIEGVREPLSAPATPIAITEENYGRLPRVYIACLRDRALSPSLQKQMYTTVPCQKVISLNSSHSPFLSAPEELADHLMAIGRGVHLTETLPA